MKRRNFLRGLLFAAMAPVASVVRVPEIAKVAGDWGRAPAMAALDDVRYINRMSDPLSFVASEMAKAASKRMDDVMIQVLKEMK